MKCDQATKTIYLYDHLSIEDKESVNQHIAQCDQCALLFEQLQEQQIMIAAASSWQEEPTDPRALTQKIMGSIEPRPQTSRPLFDVIFNKFYLAPVRYALASLSFALISFFLFEFNQGLQRTNAQLVEVGNSTVLNSSKTIQRLRIKRDEPQILSLYDCLKQCGYSDDEELCESCMGRFSKLIRNHEDS